MQKFLPILLGADFKTYSIGKSIYDEYGVNPIIINNYNNELFIDSLFNISIEKEIFNTNLFVNRLNEIYDTFKNKYEKIILFASNENYLNLIFDNLSKLKFDPILPYSKIQNDFTNKDKFYKILDDLGFEYPETIKLNENQKIESLPNGELFIRPLNINKYEDCEFEGKDNSYHITDAGEAISIIRKIFNSGYKDYLLIQEYISGKDGNQFSVNGYRSKDGSFAISQARTILTDDSGNHVVMIDSNIEKINEDTKKIIEKLNYHGLFNIDFKFNDNDGKVYITAINLRLGYPFYYSELEGTKLIKIAIEDLIFENTLSTDGGKKFGFNIFKDELTNDFITSGLFLEYNEDNRSSNNKNPLFDNINQSRLDLLNKILKRQCERRIKNRKINKSKFE